PRSRSARGCTTASARTWPGPSWPRPCARWRDWARSRPTARPAGGPRWASLGRTTYPSAGRRERSRRGQAAPHPTIGLIGAPLILASGALGAWDQVSVLGGIGARPIAVWEFSLGVYLT